MSSRTRRAALALCTALLLVTAGCSGGTTQTTEAPTGTAPTTTDGPTGTSTTATATATSTWSPNVSAAQYPPGVASNGTLTNATALLDAHFAETADSPTAFTQTWRGPNETVTRRFVHRGSATPYYSTLERTRDGRRVSVEFYATGDHSYTQAITPNRTLYQVLQNATAGSEAWTREGLFGPRLALEVALTSGNYSVNGTVERGGRTFVQLSTDEVSAAREGFFESFEGRVLVTPDGVVEDVETSHVTSDDDESGETRTSITVDRSIDWGGPPSWVGDLPHLSVSTVEDGHALELRNTGGAALPANTSFDVSVTNQTVWSPPRHSDPTGTVTIDSRLEPGESVYVTVGGDASAASFELHEEPARGEYSIVAARAVGGYENVVYRLVTGVESGE